MRQDSNLDLKIAAFIVVCVGYFVVMSLVNGVL